jgi:hypothetical protein
LDKEFMCEWVESKDSCCVVVCLRKSSADAAKYLFTGLLWEQDCVDVGQDTSSGDSDSTEKLVQLFVVLDSQSDVSGHDSALLVITGSVSSKLQDFSAQVLQDSSKVDGGTSSHASGVLSLFEVTSDTTDGELQTCLSR